MANDGTANSLTGRMDAIGPWSLWKRIGFRFLLVYCVLYAFPFPLDFLPGLEQLMSQQQAWGSVIQWLAEYILRLEQTVSTGPTGSGDSLYNWLCIGMFLVAALVITLVWSLSDQRARCYRRGGEWLSFYVSCYLGTWLIVYGFAKLIPVQFGTPGFARLLQPYGESSPMGLLWTFMGASQPYTVFSGAGEVIAGLLLYPRRTRSLGALVGFGVMLNVLVLNL